MGIVCGALPSVALDDGEVCARLQVPRGFSTNGTVQALEQLKKAAVYRYAYVRVPVDLSEEGVCRFDFGAIHSRDLCRNLGGCREAYLLGVTLGLGVDRLLTRLRLTERGSAAYFITDGLASAMAEAVAEAVFCDLSHSAAAESLKPRFSPGYGDVPLWVQKPLLARLHADKTLGIGLNDAYLMTPMKSITAFVGIKNME